MFERLAEAMLVLVVGITGVLGSLFFFYMIISLMNKLEAKFVEYQKSKAERVAEKAAEQAKAALAGVPSDAMDEDELTAIITAAAVAVIRREIIVKKIQFLNQSTSNSWAQIGRMNLIGSHDVHKVGH